MLSNTNTWKRISYTLFGSAPKTFGRDQTALGATLPMASDVVREARAAGWVLRRGAVRVSAVAFAGAEARSSRRIDVARSRAHASVPHLPAQLREVAPSSFCFAATISRT